MYDITAGADLVAQAASQEFAQDFVLYTGTETQLPDPTIEATEGAPAVETAKA